MWRDRLSKEAVNTAFDEWGGVPRMVLEKLVEYGAEGLHEELHLTVQQADLAKVKESIGALTIKRDTNQSLTHFFVEPDSEYQTVSVRFASTYIRDAVVQNLEANSERELREWLAAAAGKSETGSLAGYIFEGLSLRRLATGGRFRRRYLPCAVAPELVMPSSLNALRFRHLSQLADLAVGRFAFPAISNLAAGDALIRLADDELVIFQCTISSRHEVVAHGLDELLECFPRCTKRWLCFVVPANIFEDQWQQQQRYVTKSRGTVCQQLSLLVQSVRQCVIAMPL